MKKALFLVFVLLMSAGIYAQDNEMDPEAAKFYNEGNKLLKEGNFKGAIDNYQNALKISSDYRIHYQNGIALRKSNDLNGAEAAFKKSVELNPKFATGYNGLGGVYYAMQRYQDAINNFLKFEELSSDAQLKKKADENISRAYANLGNQAYSDGKFELAVQHLLKSVEKHSYDAAYLSLAKIYTEINKFDEAIEAADKALNSRKSITKGGPFYYKGIAFKKKGDKEKAVENFKLGLADSQYKTLCQYELDSLK